MEASLLGDWAGRNTSPISKIVYPYQSLYRMLIWQCKFAIGSSEYSSNSSHHCTGLISRMPIPALFPVSPIFAALVFHFSALVAQKHLQHC